MYNFVRVSMLSGSSEVLAFYKKFFQVGLDLLIGHELLSNWGVVSFFRPSLIWVTTLFTKVFFKDSICNFPLVWESWVRL